MTHAKRTDLQVKQQRTFSQAGRHDVATSLVLDHDTLKARTRLTGSIHSGPDSAYKAVVHLDSLTVRPYTTYCRLHHQLGVDDLRNATGTCIQEVVPVCHVANIVACTSV